jgi:hypothetical protein
MIARTLPLLALVAAGCYAGAGADDGGDADAGTTAAATTTTTGPDEPTTGTTAEVPVEPDEPELVYTADEARIYLETLSPMVVGRLLNEGEDNLIHHFGPDAIVPIIEAWIDEPAFAETARAMMQVKLAASGVKDGVDWELPGNLAAYVARNDQPYHRLITADHCADAAGTPIACDTGAPYTAGVLTTRAYLMANASRFNLRRARRMMFNFACEVYPMNIDLQPPIAKADLIPMFQAESLEEQTVPEAANGFGNGEDCYKCHSQFSAHAQLYVRFAEDGTWRADATGLQAPKPEELGRSTDGLFASHFASPIAAPKEVSQMLGVPVSTLVEGARVLADAPGFGACASRNVLEYTFGMSEAEAKEIDRKLLAELATRAGERDVRLRPDTHDGPTFGDLFVVALTHPRVIQVVLGPPTTQPSEIPGV